ncbi:MAG: 3-phosphoglycerate dehydrogenase, partial [Acutalibacteraceae bacterium]|nr:3-phosphoglycerate dehydrogenase [Acutalibacteraceae bacterium]
MYNIQTLNKISQIGLSRLGDNYSCADDMANPDAILVRSASMHDMEMPESLLAIARAGAGVNNIPLDKCSEQGIVVFNTPGANANAVKELVIAGLFMSSRKITAGIEWAKTLKGNGDAVGKMVEKGKSSFAGPEIKGKTLGVIGLGAIGVLVANAAIALGMDVIGYDPYLSVHGALQLSKHVHHVVSLDDIFANCDYITVHVPLTPDTKNIICAENIAKMKDGVRILNYSRADLCNSADVLAALESGKVSSYVTDFATDELLGVDGVIAMPHLGASTPESEDNCAKMAADEIKDYLENGNIINSVNFPAAKMARTGEVRYCVLHKNIPA